MKKYLFLILCIFICSCKVKRPFKEFEFINPNISKVKKKHEIKLLNKGLIEDYLYLYSISFKGNKMIGKIKNLSEVDRNFLKFKVFFYNHRMKQIFNKEFYVYDLKSKKYKFFEIEYPNISFLNVYFYRIKKVDI